MKKKLMVLAIVGALLCALTSGCSNSAQDGEAAVQSVAMITGGTTGLYDRYAGLVVSQNEVKIEKDGEKTIKEIKVAAGDEIEKDQILFTYDTDAMQISLDKAKLELEQLKNSITTMQSQKAALVSEKKSAPASEQLSYTVQIQSMEADIKEAEYNVTAKGKEIESMEKSMTNAEIKSPIDGVVQSLNESGATDDYGNALPFMTLVERGTYRVKGTVNENSMYALTEDTEVIIRSRVDDTITWSGRISKIDWDNQIADNSNMYGGSDEMTTSSKYPFYVELDDSDGLMLGQHVYIEPDYGQTDIKEGLWLPEVYLNEIDGDSAWVWAATDRDKLEKRSVTLGEYDEENAAYQILGGLTTEDYIAYPDDTLKEGMKVTRYDEESFNNGDEGIDGGMVDDGMVDDGAVDGNMDSGVGVMDGGAAVPETGAATGASGGDVVIGTGVVR